MDVKGRQDITEHKNPQTNRNGLKGSLEMESSYNCPGIGT